jgi:DNA damage-binding protein 1
MGMHTLEIKKLASYRTSTNPLSLAVTPSTSSSPATIAVADLMKSVSIVEIQPPEPDEPEWQIIEVSRHYATLWSSAVAVMGENEWVVADMEGNLAMLNRNPEGVTGDDRKRLAVTGEFRIGEVVNKIIPIFPPGSVAGKGKGKERSRTLSTADRNQQNSRSGPLIYPKAFLATIEGAIYMLGSINPSYIDALIRLQNTLANKVESPGYMPWNRYRAWKTEVRESDDPFRFVDGEVVEQALLRLGDEELAQALKEAGLSEGENPVGVEEARSWGEELRRLY